MKKHTKIIIAIMSMIIGVMFLNNNTYSATFHWEGSVSTNWSDPANWLEGSLPGPSDDVFFDIEHPLQECILDITTSIHSLIIDPGYGYLITFPTGNNLFLSGDLYVGNPWIIWSNTSNIILNGTGDQNITIDDNANWPFYDLTINKPSGDVVLLTDITVAHSFNIISGNTPIGGTVHLLCTPPITGGIYHISNDFAL